MPAGIFDSSSGTIWNHDNGYDNPSATELANQNNFFQNFLDPTGLVSGLWNDITGVTSQSREFSQQEYLQDKMNEYNLPANQMARLKDAGINPLAAAAGIAGGSSESAQAPAVASNAGGVANGIASVAGALGSFGSGVQAFAGAKETNALLSLRADQIKADTISSLEKAGLDHWNAFSIATLLPTMEASQQADVALKIANYHNTRKEYELLLDQHEKNLQEIRLTGSLADEQAEKARFAKAETDFFLNHGFTYDAPLDVSLRNSVVAGKYSEAESIGFAIEHSSNLSAYGQFKADADTAYSRMKASAAGAAAGNADYASYLNDLEIYKSNVTSFMQMWFALPDSLKGFAVQFLGKELYGGSAVLAGFDLNKKPSFNPTKIDNTEFVRHNRNMYGRKQYSGSW